MAGSIVVAVRKAVVAGLDALPALDDVQVTYAYVWDDTRQRERIFTGAARAVHEPAALKAARNFRNEEMEFDIILQIEGVGMTSDETDQRAIDIGAEVEGYIADRKSNELGITGLNWLRMARMELNNRGNERGTLSEITYTVRYNARLT